jgi:hypothetical protein
MLYPGESRASGSIAGALYGIIYGYGDVPSKMVCCIEKKEKLVKLGKDFYKKFYE